MKHTPQTKEELQKLVNDLSINLGDIDTSKITDMSGLFFDTPRTHFVGIEDWNVSKVENMACMFEEAEYFNQDISKWDVRNVEDMSSMFNNAKAFNQDISSWDVSNVKNMAEMFAYAESFYKDIGIWIVGNVTNLRGTFEGA